MDNNLTLKIITLGDAHVGKSSLIERISQDYFNYDNNYRKYDINFKNILIDNVDVRLRFDDTVGQERFKSIYRSYYRDVNCCLLCFDLTYEKSFDSLNMWKETLIENLQFFKNESVPIVLIGTKVDSENQIVISKERALEWCIENSEDGNNIPYFEISSKLNLNINQALSVFSKLAYVHKINHILNLSNNSTTTTTNSIKKDDNNKTSNCIIC